MHKPSFLALAIVPAALAAQQAPAVRLINAPDASTKPVLSMAAAVRQLPNGGVLVNDILKRQLVLFDNTLANATIVADSVSGGANSYGTRPGGIIPYLGDSTLFVDPAGLSMFVIGPTGAIARVASVPRSQDAITIGSNVMGLPGLDAKGRIVYRSAGGGQRIQMTRPQNTNGAAQTGLPFALPDPPDTVALVRIDASSRKLDTAAFYKIPKMKFNINQSEKGMSVTTEINPMPIVDDWAVLSDGSVAIVRGRDYHVDWINADGSMSSSPKMAFDWQRLTDEDKAAVIDSAKAAFAAAAASAAAPSGVAAKAAGAAAAADGGGRGMVVMNFSTSGGDGARTSSTFGGPGGPGGPQMTFVSINELPDYRPPFGAAGAVRADADDNVWIRTTATRSGAIGGAIYDVVDRKGEIVDRIQVPAGRTIVGFGKGGVVYMMARDDKGAWLERTKR
jgi:hypothetical protein